jgi:hypothetical protein
VLLLLLLAVVIGARTPLRLNFTIQISKQACVILQMILLCCNLATTNNTLHRVLLFMFALVTNRNKQRQRCNITSDSSSLSLSLSLALFLCVRIALCTDLLHCFDAFHHLVDERLQATDKRSWTALLLALLTKPKEFLILY